MKKSISMSIPEIDNINEQIKKLSGAFHDIFDVNLYSRITCLGTIIELLNQKINILIANWEHQDIVIEEKNKE